jgi:hypothetical protein
VSVGFPFTSAEVNSRSGQLVLTLRDTLQQIRNFQAALATKSDAELGAAPFGYSGGEIAVLRSAVKDLLFYAQEFTGRDHAEAPVLGYSIGEANTATATSATTLTRSGATWVVNAWTGRRVVAASGVFGVVVSNTATVLTIDSAIGWTNPGSITTGTTPTGTTTYAIMPAYDYRTFTNLQTGVL